MSRREAWSERENDILRAYWLSVDFYSLSNRLDRSVCGIKQQARKLGLPTRTLHLVPSETINFIRENVGILSAKQMGEHLGYSTQGIYSIARRNGVRFRAP